MQMSSTGNKIVNLIFGEPGKKSKLASVNVQNNHNNGNNHSLLGPILPSPIPQNFEVLERYALSAPYVYAVIAQDPEKKLPQYFVDEIRLSDQERGLYDQIVTTLQYEVKAPKEDTNPRKYFEEQAQQTVNRYRMLRKWGQNVSWAVLLYYAERDMGASGHSTR